ncbi:MAG: amidophosphoribosyltransferase, partial [Candidatus Nitrosotenuis sp.]
LKDRYSKKGPLRSFIEPHQSDRVEINRWIIPISEIINGKHVIVIDDSLVRGTSSKAIIKALRRAGAKKISMLITYPPIKYPCYAGIDFPSQEELATGANQGGTEEQIIDKIKSDIGADFLGYNDAQNLANAVGIPYDSMCFTCTTGNYETLGIKPQFKTREEMKGE